MTTLETIIYTGVLIILGVFMLAASYWLVAAVRDEFRTMKCKNCKYKKQCLENSKQNRVNA